jgi:hypothetical protein
MIRKIEAFSRAFAPFAGAAFTNVADLCGIARQVQEDNARLQRDLQIANLPRIDPCTSEELDHE